MKIGFIGLGIMGAPMVGRLLDGGHQVFVNDLNPIRPEILEKGATEVSSAREAAEMGDVTQLKFVAEELSSQTQSASPIGKKIIQFAEDFDFDAIKQLADILEK